MQKLEEQVLLIKYREGKCSPEELSLLNDWYSNWNREDREFLTETELEDAEAEMRKYIYTRGRSKTIQLWTRITAAASILICLSIAFYYTLYSDKPSSNLSINNNVAAGTNKAYLTLSNGKRILLTDAVNGQIASQSGVTISKTANGQIVYAQSKKTVQDRNHLPEFNTVVTPKGGHFQIILPDGTRVWLNAASSLKYPASFTKLKERNVSLDGEAYFEVAHNKLVSFKVTSRNQVVKVLGTHFNINSYADEKSIKTTLLEGSVQVALRQENTNLPEKEVILTPGEQSVLLKDNFTVSQGNPDQAIAWKEDLFKFDNTDLKSLMRQISRLYDIEVVYEGDIKNYKFYGQIARSYTLVEVLKVLEVGKVHFRIENDNNVKKVIVLP